MNIVIIGGTKYVGLSLLSYLKNDNVYILSRKKIKTKENQKSIIIDRKNEEELSNCIKDINPDVIIDKICYELNDAKIISKIVKTQEKINLKHYIMISTFFIYNYINEKEEFKKLDISCIEDNYTKNKYLAEEYLYNSDIFPITSIVRFPFIFSNDDYSKRFQSTIEEVINKSIIEVDSLKCSYIFKESAAYALSTLTKVKAQGFIDISNKGTLSLIEIYKIISDLLRKPIKFIDGKRSVYTIKKDIVLDSKKSEIFELEDLSSVIKNEVKKYLE